MEPVETGLPDRLYTREIRAGRVASSRHSDTRFETWLIV